jgi:hypothetical protein
MGGALMPLEIKSEKLLVVEGIDEKNFFSCLLGQMEIDDFDVIDVGGVDQFKVKFPALRRATGFSELKSMAIVRDAENDATSAFLSIRNILKKEGLTPPDKPNQFSEDIPRIGVFIMPGDCNQGMIEDLCLRTVKNHPALKCADAFIECISSLDMRPKNISKSKAQVFLAVMPEIVCRVGLGAAKGYWDFNSEELINLKKIFKLFKIEFNII